MLEHKPVCSSSSGSTGSDEVSPEPVDIKLGTNLNTNETVKYNYTVTRARNVPEKSWAEFPLVLELKAATPEQRQVYWWSPSVPIRTLQMDVFSVPMLTKQKNWKTTRNKEYFCEIHWVRYRKQCALQRLSLAPRVRVQHRRKYIRFSWSNGENCG